MPSDLTSPTPTATPTVAASEARVSSPVLPLAAPLTEVGSASRAGPSFARGLWRIAAADVSSGNAVELLHDGPRTFEVMLAAVESARESVALESYILRSDEIGQRFADALTRAVVRGVSARLLTDWIGMRGIRSSFVDELRTSGVEVRVFNRPGLRAWFGLIPRDHRKLLVVDSRVGVTGGVGIGDEWMGKTKRHRGHWRDTAVRIEGPAARDMQTAFDTMWDRVQKRERRGSHRSARRVARGAHLDPSTAEPALVGIVQGEPLRLRIARTLQMQAISAERSIWIANAYYELDAVIEDATLGAQAEAMFLGDLERSKEITMRSRVVGR